MTTESSDEKKCGFGFLWWLRWPLLVVFGLLAVLLPTVPERVMCGLLAIAQCLYIADGIVDKRSGMSR